MSGAPSALLGAEPHMMDVPPTPIRCQLRCDPSGIMEGDGCAIHGSSGHGFFRVSARRPRPHPRRDRRDARSRLTDATGQHQSALDMTMASGTHETPSMLSVPVGDDTSTGMPALHVPLADTIAASGGGLVLTPGKQHEGHELMAACVVILLGLLAALVLPFLGTGRGLDRIPARAREAISLQALPAGGDLERLAEWRGREPNPGGGQQDGAGGLAGAQPVEVVVAGVATTSTADLFIPLVGPPLVYPRSSS